MQYLKDRLSYLFGSTKGLILVAGAMISINRPAAVGAQ